MTMRFFFLATALSTIPVFGDVFDIRNFGAKPGMVVTSEIQAAIGACHAAGGGRVLVPAGRFMTGTIFLKSHVDLHLQAGAVLEGSLELDDYLETFQKHGMIVAVDATHVSVTGEGIIDARGIEFHDPTQNHTHPPELSRSATRQGEDYMPKGEFYSDGPIKPKPKPGMTLGFYHCSQVTLRDVTIKDTPLWAVRFAYCEDVRASGLSILNNLLVPNSDGIHCTASRNVRISDCDIRAGDDAIVVTGFTLDWDKPGFSGEAQAARTHGNKTPYAENVSVVNCHLQSRSSGIRVGYGQHPIRRCTFSNIQIYGSNRGIGVFAHDAADIEDLVFSNFTIATRLHNGQWWGNGEPIHLSCVSRFKGKPAGSIRRVLFNNILATSESGILLWGMNESRMEDIAFQNLRLHIQCGPETMSYGGNFDLRPATPIELQIFRHDIPGVYAQHVDGLRLRDVILTWGEDLPDFYTHGLWTRGVNGLTIADSSLPANPRRPDLDAVLKE